MALVDVNTTETRKLVRIPKSVLNHSQEHHQPCENSKEVIVFN